MKLSKMERRVLQRFEDERKRLGSETLRWQDVAQSLGLEQHDVSRCGAALISYGYLRQRGTGPDYQITLEGIKAVKPWPVRHITEITIVIVGAIIASLLMWVIKPLIQMFLSRFR